MTCIGFLKYWWRRSLRFRLCVKLVFVMVDMLTDLVNGITLCLRGDDIGIICGVLTLCVIFVPGYSNALRKCSISVDDDEGCGCLCEFLLEPILFPYRLIKQGVRSINNHDRPKEIERFARRKSMESIFEGGSQIVITCFFIMMTTDEVSEITIISIIFSILSCFTGCIEYTQIMYNSSEVCFHWPAYFLSAICLPDLLIFTVTAYPCMSSFWRYSFWICLAFFLIVFSTLLLIFIRFSRFFMTQRFTVRTTMRWRTAKLKSKGKLEGTFRENLRCDPFWHYPDKCFTTSFGIIIIIGDIVMLPIIIVSIWINYQEDGQIESKLILTVSLVLRIIALILNTMNFIKPSLFCEWNPRSVQICQFGELLQDLMYTWYVRQDKLDQLDNDRDLFIKFYENVHGLFQVEKPHNETFDKTLKQTIETLENIKAYRIKQYGNIRHKAETFKQTVNKLFDVHNRKHWNHKDAIPHLEKLEKLLQELKDSISNNDQDSNVIIDMTQNTSTNNDDAISATMEVDTIFLQKIIRNDENMQQIVKTFLQKLDELFEELNRNHWNDETEKFDKNCTKHLEKIEKLLLNLKDSISNNDQESNIIIDMHQE